MNLMFSALPVDFQRTVIGRLLDHLLELADKGFRFGLQFSWVSLEIIYEYFPDIDVRFHLTKRHIYQLRL